MNPIVFQIILSFFGTIGFSIIFNVPPKELLYCAIVGALGWLIFQLIITNNEQAYIMATLFSAMIVTFFSRFLSSLRKMPATVYIIPGIIPLVPGAGIYYTMFYIVSGDNNTALLTGIESVAIAGSITIGLLIILSLPQKMFRIKRR